MLDPLTAIGLVSNIVQFVEFVSRILSKSNEISASANGALAENVDLETVTTDLVGINAYLQEAAAVSSGDPALEKLCKECNDCANELLTVLRKLRIDGKPGKWKSIRKALKSVWNKDDICSVEGRLARFRDELNLRIVVGLRLQVEELSLQNSDQVDRFDNRTKAIIDAIVKNEDVFQNSIHLRAGEVKNAIKVSADSVMEQQAVVRDQIVTAVTSAGETSLTEHEATRQEIAQIKEALNAMRVQIEQKNAELRDVIMKFTSAKTAKKRQKFQELSRATSATLLALETIYGSLQTLLANIQSHAVVFLSPKKVRHLWGLDPYPAPSILQAAINISQGAASSTPVVETATMWHYSHYYFPLFNEMLQNPISRLNLVSPTMHTRWCIPANVRQEILATDASNPSHQIQAIQLLDLVQSGPSTTAYSSTAYAFVWLMALVTSSLDECFPSSPKSCFFLADAFNLGPWNSTYSPVETSEGGGPSLLDQLEQDLIIWKTIGELTGLRAALRMRMQGLKVMDAEFAVGPVEEMYFSEGEIVDLCRFLNWLLGMDRPGSPGADWREVISVSGDGVDGLRLDLRHESQKIYLVLKFFQEAGIRISV